MNRRFEFLDWVLIALAKPALFYREQCSLVGFPLG
jgi:hypothetical protein